MPSEADKLLNSVPRNLNFSLGIPLGESGQVSISSSGYKNDERIKVSIGIEIDTDIDDINGALEIINKLVAAKAN